MFNNDLDISLRVTLNAADPDGIVTADTYPAGALPLNGDLINAGRYVTSTPQFLLITTTADESSNTFTFTGRDLSGVLYSISVLGPNATTLVVPVPFASIEENGATISADASGDFSVGITTETASPWLEIDTQRKTFYPGIGITVEPNATLTYTVEYTFQNAISELPTRIFPDLTLASQTASGATGVAFGIKYARLRISSFTNGAAWIELAQPGAMNSKKPAVRVKS